MNRRRRVRTSMQPRPQPRKLASRMKFEKYARSRMYAGIHRMRAISRKRTRNEERKRVMSLRIADCGLRNLLLIVGVVLYAVCAQSINQSAIRNPQSAMSISHSQLIERLLRTAVPLVQEDVALILQIG